MTLSVFSRQQKIYLLPFVVTTILFLLLPYPTESFVGAIFKILPDICLIAYIIMTRSRFPSKTKTANLETVLPEDVYSVFILFGLVLSIFADLFLVVPALAVPGGSIFIIVHICYFLGIELSGRHQGGCDKKTSSFFSAIVHQYLPVHGITNGLLHGEVSDPGLLHIPLHRSVEGDGSRSGESQRPGGLVWLYRSVPVHILRCNCIHGALRNSDPFPGIYFHVNVLRSTVWMGS